MRAKVAKHLRHKARGISLPPEVEKSAMRKCIKLDVSFSNYVQRLIRQDLAAN